MAKKTSKKTTPKKKAAKKTKKPAKRVVAKKATGRKVKSAARGSRAASPKLGPEKQVKGGIFLGEVEDFFSHVGVVAITLQKPLAVGDTIRIKGHTTDITQKVESMEIEHNHVQAAAAKDSVGIKIVDRARKGDAVFKISVPAAQPLGPAT